MTDLQPLIRLHRWQLDEKRRALAELEALSERLHDQIAQLDEELVREQAFAAEAAEPPPGFGAYTQTMLDRKARLNESILEVQQQIAASRDQIAEAFQELKRFELVEEDRERRDAARRKRRETQAYDEIGTSRFHRRKEAGANE